jgi:hypothetical protein
MSLLGSIPDLGSRAKRKRKSRRNRDRLRECGESSRRPPYASRSTDRTVVRTKYATYRALDKIIAAGKSHGEITSVNQIQTNRRDGLKQSGDFEFAVMPPHFGNKAGDG